MKGQGSFILALVFALIVAIFAVINVDSVEVNYLFGTGSAPLILVILGSVLMGGVIAGAFGMVRIFRLQRSNRVLQKQLEEVNQTNANTEKDPIEPNAVTTTEEEVVEETTTEQSDNKQ